MKYPKLSSIDSSPAHKSLIRKIDKNGGEVFLKYLEQNFVITKGGRIWTLERPTGSNGYYYLLIITHTRTDIRLSLSIEHCEYEPRKKRMTVNFSLYEDENKLKSINGSYLYIKNEENSYIYLTNFIDAIYQINKSVTFMDYETDRIEYLLYKSRKIKGKEDVL